MSKSKVVLLDNLVGSVVTLDPPCGCGSVFAVIEEGKGHKHKLVALVARCRGCGRFLRALDRADVFGLVWELRALRRYVRAFGGGGGAAA